MTGYQPPRRQARYEDTGRRQITLLGRPMLATLVKLKPSDALLLKADYEIFVDRAPGLSPPQTVGQVIDFDGRLYRVVRAMDPRAAEINMRGKYVRMLCVEQES